MKKGRIPTILGIAFLVVGIVVGVALIKNRQIFRLRASPEVLPKNVRVSNITDSSFTVSWVTDKETQGFIRWGANTSLDKTKIIPSDTPGFTHSFLIEGLSPSSVYYFNINSGGKGFDNNGVAWRVKTGLTIPNQPKANIISGSVISQAKIPVKNALVYVQVGGSSLLSTITSEEGTWVIPISAARTQNLSSYIPINDSTTLVEISVQTGPSSIASAQIYPAAAKPVPTIMLGQTHNFRSLSPEKEEEIPDASVALPSGFSSPSISPSPTPPQLSVSIRLESLINSS